MDHNSTYFIPVNMKMYLLAAHEPINARKVAARMLPRESSNNFSLEVKETRLDCWQGKVAHHCIRQIASVH
jgi:hypothetical protein